MDDDAATLLPRTHATLVRQLSEIAGHHFEGLQAAARYKSLNLTNRHRRQLCHLDIAFNWSRHVTSVKCAAVTAEILKHVSPAPAATCAATATPAPVNEHVAPAPVIEYIAPAPAVTYVVPSQQSPPVYTTTTVTTDDNLDMTGLVYLQFSSIAVEPFAPHVVGSLPPLEEFTEHVYNQVHQ